MPALVGLLWRLSAYASKILLMEDESGAAVVIALARTLLNVHHRLAVAEYNVAPHQRLAVDSGTRLSAGIRSLAALCSMHATARDRRGMPVGGHTGLTAGVSDIERLGFTAEARRNSRAIVYCSVVLQRQFDSSGVRTNSLGIHVLGNVDERYDRASY